MNYAVLITGDLAAGKTSLARALGTEMKIPFFYKDRIKELLADRIGYKNREENKKLSVAAFDVLSFIAGQMAQSRESFILESNFRQNELELLYELFEWENTCVVTVVLSAKLHTLYQRYCNRITNENRHPAHLVFASEEEFNDYMEKLRQCDYRGEVLKIDAESFDFLKEDAVRKLGETIRKLAAVSDKR